MKIAILGAQGVGKTTLAQALVDHTSTYSFSFTLLPEAARLAIEAGFHLDERATIETELWIILKQLELERAEGYWVADRCAIDLLAYITYLFPNQSSLIDLANKVLEPNFSKYDLIIYLPPKQFPIENDGVRNGDEEFQLAIDREIMKVLNYYRLPFVEIVGTPEERLKKVLGRIKIILQDAVHS